MQTDTSQIISFFNGSQHKPAFMWPLFTTCSTVALKCEFQQTQTNNKATILFKFHCENDQRHTDKKCYHTFEKHIAKTRQTRLRYERKDTWLWSWNPLVLRTDWTDWRTETSAESNIKHIHSATQSISAWTKSFPSPLKLVTCGKPRSSSSSSYIVGCRSTLLFGDWQCFLLKS